MIPTPLLKLGITPVSAAAKGRRLHADDSHPGLLLTTQQGTVSAAKANTLPPGGRRRWDEVLHHAAPILLWDRPAREADVHLRAGRGGSDPCPSQWPRHSGALPHHHRGIPRGPGGGGGMHLHVVLAGRSSPIGP